MAVEAVEKFCQPFTGKRITIMNFASDGKIIDHR
jgi:hypothetical protein